MHSAQVEVKQLCALAKTRPLSREERDRAIALAFADSACFDPVFDEIIFGAAPATLEQEQQPVR